MEVSHYIEEIEKYINSFKLQIENEKKELTESEKKFSVLKNAFNEKAPSNSIINSLFKDEPEGFVFSKQEEKRKQLAEQRRAEYNAFLEKKESELLSKKRNIEERRSVSPKSILESVNYEQVLAKRKEEEAKFRNMNLTDVLNSSKPNLNENNRKNDFNAYNYANSVPTAARTNNVNLPGSTMGLEEALFRHPTVEEQHNFNPNRMLNNQPDDMEEKIKKYFEEQKRQMLLDFENQLKNDKMKEEILSLKSFDQEKLPPKRTNPMTDDYPTFGRTGGGGEPVRDSYGNLMTMRGLKKDNEQNYQNIIPFPSLQQQPVQDRMTMYREELKRQIEEKRRLEMQEKEKARLLEDRIAQRIEEQRLKMLQEYENEKKTDKVKEEFQRQQERLRNLEEFQRRDAEERQKRNAALRAQEKPPPPPQPPVVPVERSQSPPIPAVRTKNLLEKAVPPVTSAKALTEVKPENVFSSLAEIRRKIKEEQEKPKRDLQKSYEVMNRRTVQEVSDDEDDPDLLKSSYSYSD